MNRKAFTLFEFLLVIAVLAILAVIFLSALQRPRHSHTPRIYCANNQKMLGLALKVWALDNNDLLPMQTSITNCGTMERISTGTVFPHFQVLSNELSTPKILFCPADRERQPATNFTSSFSDAHISYFLNVDMTNGSDVVVSTGDRNLTNKTSAHQPFLLITNNSRLIWDQRIHTEQANVGLADGSVLQVSNHRQNIVTLGEGETNRLAVP